MRGHYKTSKGRSFGHKTFFLLQNVRSSATHKILGDIFSSLLLNHPLSFGLNSMNIEGKIAFNNSVLFNLNP